MEKNSIDFESLNRNIIKAIEEVKLATIEEDKNLVGNIIRSVTRYIIDILQQNGYNNVTLGKAEEMLEENKDEILRKINNKREEKAISQQEGTKSIFNENRIDMSDNTEVAKRGKLSMAEFEQFNLAIDKDQSYSTIFAIEDCIQTVLKDRFRRLLNIYDDERGEKTFYEISQVLSQKLQNSITNGYLENTSIHNQELSEKVQDLLEQSIREVEKNKQKESEEKSLTDTLQEQVVEETDINPNNPLLEDTNKPNNNDLHIDLY